jgi:hypothetical protein
MFKINRGLSADRTLLPALPKIFHGRESELEELINTLWLIPPELRYWALVEWERQH